MRRFFVILLLLTLIFALAVPASAATEASMMALYASVAPDGSAQVTLTATIRLDAPQKNLTFPVPLEAYNITFNGARVSTDESGNAQLIDLSDSLGRMAGEYSFTITYTLEDVIGTSAAGTPQVELPMLSGFAYNITQFEYSVSLPGQVDAKPAFSSGYHQSSIEQDLSQPVLNGTTVSGRSLKALKDHETLEMFLSVSEEMFPDTPIVLDEAIFDDIAMAICAALALLYWLLFLRTGPVRRRVGPNPVDGFTAGEVGSILTLRGADLTMMVFGWGQLGYVLIQPDRNGRVLLHKRMEMGNERSGYEQKIFRTLFGKASQVNGTSMAYARLVHKVASLKPENRGYYLRRSGSTMIFRLLLALVGALGGIALGIALGGDRAWLGILLAVFLAVFGFASSFMMQDFIRGLHLRRRMYLFIGLGLVYNLDKKTLAQMNKDLGRDV